MLDIDARIDHRSLEDQGIDLEPQHKIGPAAGRMAGEGVETERLEDHIRIARENGDRIIADARGVGEDRPVCGEGSGRGLRA